MSDQLIRVKTGILQVNSPLVQPGHTCPRCGKQFKAGERVEITSNHSNDSRDNAIAAVSHQRPTIFDRLRGQVCVA